jgi:hypothetical protein
MKKLLAIVTAFGLFMMPFVVYAQSEQTTAQAPAIEQPLVPEGDFAMKLVGSLKMGAIETEAQAEDMLSSVGIAPRNGWIADYPVTPDIIGELQKAVVAAADSNKLPMGRVEALKAFQNLTAEFGLAAVPDTSGKYSENQPPTNPEYLQPTVIDNYYYDEGPPVVTYYPPPWDYYYLYAWVPYPFWWGGFFFPGFFCLHDFHRVVLVGHHRFVVTNHVIDPFNKAVVRVDPAGRRTGETFRTGGISHNRTFNSAEARRGATSIFERSRERSASVNKVERDRTGAVSSGRENRTFSQPNNIERRNEMNLQRPSGGQGRSFSAPNLTHERSFNAPSTGGRSFGSSENSGRSFSPPSRSFSAPRGSSEGFHGGGSSGSHSFGGFSVSHSFSGFSGGHGGFSGSHSFRGGFSGGGFHGGGFHGGGRR